MTLNITARVGNRIYPEGWKDQSTNLEVYDYCNYDAICDMKETRLALPSPSMTDISYPIIVEVTGRTIQRKFGEDVVRVKLTWVNPDHKQRIGYGFMELLDSQK